MEAHSGSSSSKVIRIDVLLLALASLASAFVYWWLFSSSDAVHGGMDSYNHYLISRFSWDHPKLLLDQWGKPMYTMLASPFAQFGLGGIVVFNIVCLLGSTWLVWSSAQKLGFKYPILAGFTMLFSPFFTDHVVSGLTEPFNAVFLSAILYFLAHRRFIPAAILTGFLPFVRSEGFVIGVPLFAYFIVEKRYKDLIWLLLPSLIFNVLGYLIEDAPLWIFTHNPYIKAQVAARGICGSGSLFHYLRYSGVVFGRVALLGCVLAVVLLVIKKKIKHSSFWWLLGLGIPALLIAVHSYIWWKGMMGSCGYLRVLIIVSPSVVLLGAFGLDAIIQRIPRFQPLAVLVLVILLMYAPYKYFNHRYPVPKSHEQLAFEQVHQFLKHENLLDRKMYFLYPYLNILNGSDPYNPEEHVDLWSYDPQYHNDTEIVIWDSHFGPNEANLPLENLLYQPGYTLLFYTKTYHKDPKLRHLPMEVYVFEIK